MFIKVILIVVSLGAVCGGIAGYSLYSQKLDEIASLQQQILVFEQEKQKKQLALKRADDKFNSGWSRIKPNPKFNNWTVWDRLSPLSGGKK